MRTLFSRLIVATLVGGLTACGSGDSPTAPAELSQPRRAFVPLTPTRTVLRSTDAGAGSLREAVASAVPGDVIAFADSISMITLTSQITVAVPLTLQGRETHVILAGGGVTRLLRAEAQLTVLGMTLQDAKVVGDGGGAILSTTQDALVLEDVDLLRNQAIRGGAVYAEALHLRNVNAADNSANTGGGAIAVEQQLTALESTFSRNSAEYGAALSLNWPSTIDGVTFTGNVARYGGGAISATGGAVTVTNSEFVDNLAIQGNGGAILLQPNVSPQSLFITGSTFTNNFARSTGGALDVLGPLTIQTSRFERNTGAQGGGVYQRNGATSVSNTVFDGNIATGSGGAVSMFQGALTSLDNEFVDNRAFSAAAIMIELDASAEIMTNRFLRNVVEGSGGAVYAFGELTVNRSEFVENTAMAQGGAIFAAATTSVTNSTFAQNGAAYGAAVIAYGMGIEATLRHVTLASNAATALGGSALGTVDYGTIVLANSIMNGGGCGLGAYQFRDRNLDDSNTCPSGQSMTIGATPLAALAFNGGSTRNMAIDADSPALDAGVNCIVAVDQRGVSRPQFASCDLGAFEYDVPITATFAVNASGTVNVTTGVAVVSGTVTCSRPTTVELEVSAVQLQKAGKISTTIQASSSVPVACGPATKAWAAALTPPTGAFSNAPMTVTAGLSATNAFTTAPTVTRAGVKMSWSKR